MGCMYTLLASGLTLIFGILNIPNFGHGALYMLGAFFTYFFVTSMGINYWLCLVLTFVSIGVIGFVIERIIFHPIRNAPHANGFAAALGLLIILQGGVLYLFGGDFRQVPVPYSAMILSVGPIVITLQRLMMIVSSIAIMIMLQLFIKKTVTGATIEAVAQNSEGAQLLGISVNRVRALTFLLGTALAGVAGTLMAPITSVHPNMGFGPLLIAFAAVIFGGMGSLPGAMIGAFICGIVETLTAGYISAAYKDLAIFAVMIAILLLLPQGLMGKRRS